MTEGAAPRVGVAYGPVARALLATDSALLDYVEVPFEQLRHDPTTLGTVEGVPVILHCASMSIAGFVEPEEETLAAIRTWAEWVDTPWIGEHLAFISAQHPDELAGGVAAEPTHLTYTMAPQLSEAVIEQVGKNLSRLREHFDHHIIVENSPQYFDVPGSEMSQIKFIAEVAERFDVDLLLDLTHLAVSAHNLAYNVVDALKALPLHRVVEVHLSGMSVQAGVAWDDHANLAPPEVVDLLPRVLDAVCPRAVTLEYNWAPDHRLETVVEQIEAVRSSVAPQPADVS
jgi:uncharacterized protein (UPF0276 family)